MHAAKPDIILQRTDPKMRFFPVRTNATLAALLVAAAVGSVQGRVACSPECENAFRSGCMPRYCGQGNTDSVAWKICQQEINAGVGPLAGTCSPGCVGTGMMTLAKFCGCDSGCGDASPVQGQAIQGQAVQGQAVQGAVGAPRLLSNPPGRPQELAGICDGRPRSNCAVQLDVPQVCVTSTTPCPIVFYLHGAEGNNREYASTSGVHTSGYIGVYPQGERGWNTWPKDYNDCDWNDYSCTTDPDEGEFFAYIIAGLRDRGATGNVYLVGISNGASLAHRLAANAGPELPIKGIVVDVMPMLASPERSGPGRLNYNQPGRGSPPVSVLSVMGTIDNLIPYAGGGSLLFGEKTAFRYHSALGSMAVWASHNRCAGARAPQTSNLTWLRDILYGRATKFVYGGCPNNVIVEHYQVENDGRRAGGVSIGRVKIKYDIMYDFINRVEAGIRPPPSVGIGVVVGAEIARAEPTPQPPVSQPVRPARAPTARPRPSTPRPRPPTAAKVQLPVSGFLQSASAPLPPTSEDASGAVNSSGVLGSFQFQLPSSSQTAKPNQRSESISSATSVEYRKGKNKRKRDCDSDIASNADKLCGLPLWDGTGEVQDVCKNACISYNKRNGGREGQRRLASPVNVYPSPRALSKETMIVTGGSVFGLFAAIFALFLSKRSRSREMATTYAVAYVNPSVVEGDC